MQERSGAGHSRTLLSCGSAVCHRVSFRGLSDDTQDNTQRAAVLFVALAGAALRFPTGAHCDCHGGTARDDPGQHRATPNPPQCRSTGVGCRCCAGAIPGFCHADGLCVGVRERQMCVRVFCPGLTGACQSHARRVHDTSKKTVCCHAQNTSPTINTTAHATAFQQNCTRQSSTQVLPSSKTLQPRRQNDHSAKQDHTTILPTTLGTLPHCCGRCQPPQSAASCCTCPLRLAPKLARENLSTTCCRAVAPMVAARLLSSSCSYASAKAAGVGSHR